MHSTKSHLNQSVIYLKGYKLQDSHACETFSVGNMNTEHSSVIGEESEDDFDWEEVEVAHPTVSADASATESAVAPSLQEYYGDVHGTEEGPSSQKPHLEITIKTKGKAKGDPKCVCRRFSGIRADLTAQEEREGSPARCRAGHPR